MAGLNKAGAAMNFQQHGYEWINEDNVESVIGFLDDLESAGLEAMYSSKYLITKLQEMYEDVSLLYGEEETSAAFNRANKRGLTPEQLAGNVAEWLGHYEEVAQGRRSGKLRVYSKFSSSLDIEI